MRSVTVTEESEVRPQTPKTQVGASGQYKHRSGWPYVVEALQQARTGDRLALVDYVERTFKYNPDRSGVQRLLRDWALQVLPLRWVSPTQGTPWVGIFHHPPNLPEWFDPAAPLPTIFAGGRFRRSRPYLRGAIALSDYLAEWLRDELGVPTLAIKHPTEFPASTFSWDAFASNPDKKVVQIGWYLRNYRAIYQVPVPETLQKVHLAQQGAAIAEAKRRTDRYSPYRGRPDRGDVRTLSWLENEEYDRLLTENIVFLELFDASANNAIIEAIVRETPVVVNRHPAVVEYLGANYPLLYTTLDEVPDLLRMARLKEAHDYLHAMDKSDLRITHFITTVQRFLSEIS